MTATETTWDGLPIAADHPRGAGVVIRRPSGAPEGFDCLLLHRHHHGPDFEGDWAWTSPSGARLPGEAVLIGAERELAEEAGLTGVELRPVDLSGMWAFFTAEVPADAQVVIDPEHDRFEWLPPSNAVARMLPVAVREHFLRGVGTALPDLTLRPLTRDDLPAMLEWFAAPHAAGWGGPTDLDTLMAKYGPRIDGEHHVRVDVLEVDGTPAGFLQSYRLADEPAYAAAIGALGSEGAVAISYIIGDPVLVGRGIGPQAIWAYVRDVVFSAFPDVRQVVATPSIRNTRSIRALEKAGFQRLRDMLAPLTPTRMEVQAVCVLDRARIFGS